MYSNGEEYGIDDDSLGEYAADGTMKKKEKKEKGGGWFSGGKSKKPKEETSGFDDGDAMDGYGGFTGSYGVNNDKPKKKSGWFGGGDSKKKPAKSSSSSADPLDSLFSSDAASSNNFGFDDPVQETSDVKAFFDEVSAHLLYLMFRFFE
jgi:hypothetical protein